MTLIAIDPGMNGGIAVNDSVSAIHAIPMPATEGDVLHCLENIRLKAMQRADSFAAVVEDQVGCVGPNMRVSAAAMFTFGRGFGFLLGVLESTFWRVHLVRPQKWQSGLSLGSKKESGGNTAWKNKLKQRAQQLFPNIPITLKTADALLLLEYAAKAGLN